VSIPFFEIYFVMIDQKETEKTKNTKYNSKKASIKAKNSETPKHSDKQPRKSTLPVVGAVASAGGFRQGITDLSKLNQLEVALEKERQRFFSVLDIIPAFIFLVSPDHKIHFANQRFRDLFGDPDGRPCYEILVDRQAPCKRCQTFEVLKTKKSQQREWHRKGRHDQWFILHNDLFRSSEGEDLVLEIGLDITQRKRAEKSLFKSEEKYRNLFEHMPSGVAVFEVVGNGEDFIFRDFNGTGEKIDDVKREDLMGKSVREAFPGIKDFGLLDVLQRVFRTGVSEYFPDARYHDDRTPEVWRENWVYKLPTNEIVAIYNDVSERKKSQEFIRKLTHELIKHQEKERHMISLELHDTVAQDLISLKMISDLLFQELQDAPDERRNMFSNFSKILQKSIDKVRDISYDLRPPGLDHYGVINAVYEYVHDFSEQTGIHVDLMDEGIKDKRFNYYTEINLYRLVQEGLNNIRKHADAVHVTIRFGVSRPNMILSIEDDGKGFDVEEYRKRRPTEKRMGLRSMEERTRLLNGTMTIESRPKNGTKIRMEIPIEGEADERQEDHPDR